MTHAVKVERIRQRFISDLRATSERPTPVANGMIAPTSGAMPIGTGRHLEATVLFLDLCAFSSRPLETMPEQSATLRILTLLFSGFIRIIEDHGGVVEKNTGDGLMAYFHRQAGESHNHQSRAVEAALYMFLAADKVINPSLLRIGLAPFDFRVTINTGNITVAEVGARGRFRGIVAIGTAANVASKMLAVAGKNEMLLGEKTVLGLRADWQSNVALHSISEQFSYREDGRGYPYFLYTHRFI